MNKVKYWLEIAEYDLETAKAMIKTGRYLYVGFMCHQVIEKVLKGYYQKTLNETPPYTHNLLILAKDSGIIEQINDEQKQLLFELNPLNIDSRYPSYKEKISKSLNSSISKDLLVRTEELFTWIKNKL
jgi:HEPN domain-containing protein